jgi:UPF0271 protein
VLRAVTEGRARSINGRDVKVAADSICVHSDTPGALAIARAVHQVVANRL